MPARGRGVVRWVGLGEASLGRHQHFLGYVLGQMFVPHDPIGDPHHDRVLSSKELLELPGLPKRPNASRGA